MVSVALGDFGVRKSDSWGRALSARRALWHGFLLCRVYFCPFFKSLRVMFFCFFFFCLFAVSRPCGGGGVSRHAYLWRCSEEAEDGRCPLHRALLSTSCPPEARTCPFRPSDSSTSSYFSRLSVFFLPLSPRLSCPPIRHLRLVPLTQICASAQSIAPTVQHLRTIHTVSVQLVSKPSRSIASQDTQVCFCCIS